MNIVFSIISAVILSASKASSLLVGKDIRNDFTWHGGYSLFYTNVNGDSFSIQGAANESIGSRGFESKEFLTGDYNISLLFYQSSICSNLGISIFKRNNFWDWDFKKGRLSLQIDCGFPLLFGECSVSNPYEFPVISPGYWYRMTLVHTPSLGLTSGIIFRVDELIETQVAFLSISESYNDILYKYGICGDSNDNEKPALFENVTISSSTPNTNLVNTEIASHFLIEKTYNLAKPLSAYNDFILHSGGMLTYGLADPDILNIFSLNIMGLSNSSQGARGLESLDYLSGDSNITVSFYQSEECSNAGLSIFPQQNFWNWGPHKGRISFQIDCGFPVLFGKCTDDDHFNHPVVTPGSWYTMVLSHRPSSGRTFGYVYKGLNSSSDLISISMIDESFPEVRYKFGLCADQNDPGLHTQFDNLRVNTDSLYESGTIYVEEMYELSVSELSTSFKWMGGSNLSHHFIDGIAIYGDSRYSQGARGLESLDYLSGDSNITVSFYQSGECSNAGLSIFPQRNFWNWGPHKGRISFQIDCGFPVLFGECTDDDHFNHPVVTPGSWYTMVLSHRPSSGRTFGYIYRNPTASLDSPGVLIGEVQIREYFSSLHKYGIAADNTDDYQLTHFKKLHINTIKITKQIGIGKATKNSLSPSIQTTYTPTVGSTILSSTIATLLPSKMTSKSPSRYPSMSPSIVQNISPSSLIPTNLLRLVSTTIPSVKPSFNPSTYPTLNPSTSTITFPTFTPSVTPSTPPSSSPTAVPSTINPSTSPITFATFTPSVTPSTLPSSSPTAVPSTINPSVSPSAFPTFAPSFTPSTLPSSSPTAVPSTINPSTSPSNFPTFPPSVTPSTPPSSSPTAVPSTFSPTIVPSYTPTSVPSKFPTLEPTSIPSFTPEPTIGPTGPSVAPTISPSVVPSYTVNPTRVPTANPSFAPSSGPSFVPTILPTTNPSQLPSAKPSIMPTVDPTSAPSQLPSTLPSIIPSGKPSYNPSELPSPFPSTFTPSMSPSVTPSVKSSIIPSVNPSTVSTIRPSLSPSKSPSSSPSNRPSFVTTNSPSVASSVLPTRPLTSLAPTLPPTYMITNSQTIKPTNIPNNLPIFTSTLNPTIKPSSEVPTYIPTPLPAPQISFINTMTVQLKLGCLAMNDNKTLDTFLKSQSEVMNISESNLYYQGCSKVNRRLLSKDMNSRIRLQDSSYDLATKVVIELSRTDTTGGGGESDKIINTAASAIFLKLTTALATSVKNGTFAKIMQATAKSLGLNTNSSTFQVTSTASTGFQVTIYTHSPTKSPSLKPSRIPTIYQTISPASSISISQPMQETIVTNNVSIGLIVGIAVAVVVIVSILVAVIYYLRRNQLKKESTVYIEDSPDTDFENAPVQQVAKVKVDQRSFNKITNDRQHHIADDVGQVATNQRGDLHIYDIDEFGETIVKSH